jgi:hypothetical protein
VRISPGKVTSRLSPCFAGELCGSSLLDMYICCESRGGGMSGGFFSLLFLARRIRSVLLFSRGRTLWLDIRISLGRIFIRIQIRVNSNTKQMAGLVISVKIVTRNKVIAEQLSTEQLLTNQLTTEQLSTEQLSQILNSLNFYSRHV